MDSYAELFSRYVRQHVLCRSVKLTPVLDLFEKDDRRKDECREKRATYILSNTYHFYGVNSVHYIVGNQLLCAFGAYIVCTSGGQSKTHASAELDQCSLHGISLPVVALRCKHFQMEPIIKRSLPLWLESKAVASESKT